MAEQGKVSFDQVARAATTMLQKGITPSVRNVIAVTGGKTETVAEYLKDFNEKRKADVLKMSDELGSSAIAKLLASEVQTVVYRKTEEIQNHLQEVCEQRDELIDLLKETQQDSNHKIEMAEAKATQVINEAGIKERQANERAEEAEIKANEYRVAAEEAKKESTAAIKAAESKAELLIANAKSEADSLVAAANKRADKAEQETATLREQVKSLSIEEAKREIEKAQYLQTQDAHQQSMLQLAEERTNRSKLQIQYDNQAADIKRLTRELAELRGDSKQLAVLQGQFIELQKQFTQSQRELAQSEREKESLKLALSRTESKIKS